MFIDGLTADALATNCHILAADEAGSCVVVDPGVNVGGRLGDLLTSRGLRPEGVLLTHGHVDHTAGAARVERDWGVPVFVHPADQGQLTDPASAVGIDLRVLLGEDFIWQAPQDVRTYPTDGVLHLAGLRITVVPAPGHTPGSVLLLIGESSGGPGDEVCCAGDVLFAGSVGRTDLPGGDPGAMLATLRDRILSLPDGTVVLSGHGPRTTIGRERRRNPFVRAAMVGQGGTTRS